MGDQILRELQRIRSELEKLRSSSGTTDLGLFVVWVLLGLILWRVW